jgi:histidinol-phosphate aminotransferase
MKNIFRNQVNLANPYVTGKSVEEIQKELGLASIERLCNNENPLGPSMKAVKAIEKELQNINMYPVSGEIELQKKLAEKHGLSASNIVIGNGGEELLKAIAETFINDGDEAIMASTTFGRYSEDVRFMGGTVVALPLKNFKHDFQGFIDNITEKTKLIYVCNPNNPTGTIMTEEEVQYLVKNVPEDVVIAFDEAYYDYALKNADFPNTLSILKARKNTIILRTFSKILGLAAVRIGYLLTSEEIAEAMGRFKLTFTVNRLALAAATAALEDSEHIKRSVDLNYKALALMENFFEEKGLEYVKSNANFIFVNVNRHSKFVAEKLLKKGIMVRPAYFWGWDNWLRVSTGTIKQTEKFIAKLSEILNESSMEAGYEICNVKS